MARFFNTAGPCRPEKHYMLPPEGRLPQLRELIDRDSYFVVHAPRQAGKTTSLSALAHRLTAEGRHVAALLSVEVGAPFGDDPEMAEAAILASLREQARSQLPDDLQPPPWPDVAAGARIQAALGAWAGAAPWPLVLFLDEIDALADQTLISILRQLRIGFSARPSAFPAAVALIGVRDVRDYRAMAEAAGRLGTASPFNIKAESITLRDFTAAEVAALYGQHTAETGQPFTPEALERAFELTRGQPWLTNALAAQLVDVLVPDRARTITSGDVDRARDLLIERQDTHLDSLLERLREPRLQALLEPMLAGDVLGDVPADDRRFAIDLGLLRRDAEGGLSIANPIYKEIIVRALTQSPLDAMPQLPAAWLRSDGRLDLQRLRDSFLAFWRQHGEPLLGAAPYHEIAPHLVLLAFLSRVANGGGTIEREYAVGSGRMDLCLRRGPDLLAVEIKVWRPGRPDPALEGLAQLDRYLARLAPCAAWLVLFDRRPDCPPVGERIGSEERLTPDGRVVEVIRA